MVRTKPSATVLALIAEVEKHGCTANPFKVERWQKEAWLPRSRDWLVPGSAVLRPEIVHRAVQLAALSRPGRSIAWRGWVFWAFDDAPESAQRLRAALTTTLQRPFVRADVEQVPTGDSDRSTRARRKAADRLLEGRRSHRRDFDAILRSHAEAAGFELPSAPSRSMPSPFHRAVLETGARMMLGGSADVTFEDLMQTWEQACPDGTDTIERARTAHRKAALNAGDDVDYVDLLEQSPLADGLPGLLRTVEEPDDRTICAAVRLCTTASGTLKLLFERAAYEPEILPRLMNDVMWDLWAPHGGIVPDGVAGEAVITLSTVQYLVVPGWPEDLERYRSYMEALLLAPPPKGPNP